MPIFGFGSNKKVDLYVDAQNAQAYKQAYPFDTKLQRIRERWPDKVVIRHYEDLDKLKNPETTVKVHVLSQAAFFKKFGYDPTANMTAVHHELLMCEAHPAYGANMFHEQASLTSSVSGTVDEEDVASLSSQESQDSTASLVSSDSIQQVESALSRCRASLEKRELSIEAKHELRSQIRKVRDAMSLEDHAYHQQLHKLSQPIKALEKELRSSQEKLIHATSAGEREHLQTHMKRTETQLETARKHYEADSNKITAQYEKSCAHSEKVLEGFYVQLEKENMPDALRQRLRKQEVHLTEKLELSQECLRLRQEVEYLESISSQSEDDRSTV